MQPSHFFSNGHHLRHFSSDQCVHQSERLGFFNLISYPLRVHDCVDVNDLSLDLKSDNSNY